MTLADVTTDFDPNEVRAQLSSTIEGFSEFFEGYLLGLAFTAQQYKDEYTEPEPLFGCPGMDIGIDVDADLWDYLSDDEQRYILADCEDFIQHRQLWVSEASDHDIGSNFHLSRNRHGSGLWDRGYSNGDRLHKLAIAQGPCELVSADGEWIITT